MPDALFTAAREGDMLLELENFCLESIFAALRGPSGGDALRQRVRAS